MPLNLQASTGSATLVWNSPMPVFREDALTWHKKDNYPLCPKIIEKMLPLLPILAALPKISQSVLPCWDPERACFDQ